MIDLLTFVPAVAVILATPGPTNTLLASSGAQAGFRDSLPLVPAELFGYALAIAGWGLVLEPASAGWPWLKPTLRLACAFYLVAVARGLWSKAGDTLSKSGFGTRRVFAATLLNPKALLFAAVIFPEAAFQNSAAFAQAMGIFAAVIVPIALAWIGLGSTLSRPEFFIGLTPSSEAQPWSCSRSRRPSERPPSAEISRPARSACANPADARTRLPRAPSSGSGAGLLGIVVTPIGNGPAVLHHVCADIFPLDRATGEDPLVAVAPGGAAADNLASNKIDQGPPGRLAAGIGASGDGAALLHLGRVDAFQTDARLADADRVPIRDLGSAFEGAPARFQHEPSPAGERQRSDEGGDAARPEAASKPSHDRRSETPACPNVAMSR